MCGVLDYGERARRVPVKDISSVDNAAEITILSESVHDSMSSWLKVLSNVNMNLAGGGSCKSVGSLGPVQFGIGSDTVKLGVLWRERELNTSLTKKNYCKL